MSAIPLAEWPEVPWEKLHLAGASRTFVTDHVSTATCILRSSNKGLQMGLAYHFCQSLVFSDCKRSDFAVSQDTQREHDESRESASASKFVQTNCVWNSLLQHTHEW